MAAGAGGVMDGYDPRNDPSEIARRKALALEQGKQAQTSISGTRVNNGQAVVNTGGSIPFSGGTSGGAMGGLQSLSTSRSPSTGDAMQGGPSPFSPSPYDSQVFVNNPDPKGGPLLTQGGYENERLARLQDESQAASQKSLLNERARLNAEAEARRMASVKEIQGGAQAPHVGDQNFAANETAARASAFAQAKDLSGQNAAASIKALQGMFANQGLTGSTAEGAAEGAGLGEAAGGVNDFIRQQYIQDLLRAGQVSDRNYAGQVQQRGQDMSMQQSLLSLLSQGGALY